MKIEGPGKTQAGSGIKKSGAARKGDGPAFSSLLDDAIAADGASGLQGTSGISQVTAPLVIGDATEEQQKRKAAIQQGHSLLDALELIRDGLLMGTIPESRLSDLQQRMREQIPTTTDPNLQEVMREIEIRAAVELAKLGK